MSRGVVSTYQTFFGSEISKMAGWRRKSNPSLRVREGQEYSRVDFYKAIYAIRSRIDRQTKGIACAVKVDGQNNDKTTDSALLITWGEIGQRKDYFMDRFSRKSFGEYRLLPLNIESNGHFCTFLHIFARLNPVLQTKGNARPAVVRSP